LENIFEVPMIYDMYFFLPEFITREVEYVFRDDRFKGIKSLFYSSESSMSSNSETIPEIIAGMNCDNDILILFEGSYPQQMLKNDFTGSVSIHTVENVCGMFVGFDILKENLEACDFIVLSSWVDNWRENILDFSVYGVEPQSFFSQNYSSILVVDTGFYVDVYGKVAEFSKFTGLPFEILNVNMDHFSLALENIILLWSVEKKQSLLRESNKKAASYAMSLDFIRKMADVSNTSDAVASICKLYELMFAPKSVLYHSLVEDVDDIYKSSFMGEELINSFRNSDANYLTFNKGNSFCVKISTTDGLLGMVEVSDIAHPEHMEEYLSIALDIAKASSLTLLSIRRYQEISESRKKYVEIADMLRTTNRILRHDIANSLQIVTSALDMYSNSDDVQFIIMAKKAADKGVSLIRNMHDLDLTTSPNEDLDFFNVKDLVLNSLGKYDVSSSVNGDCLIKADAAFNSVVDNIISNAIVHGRSSQIDVSIMQDDNVCRIEFADDGIGIPEDVKPRVFDEGFKYGETGHTGFGMFIVRKTIDRYGGKVWVEDNSPKGSKFVIELDAVLVDNLR